MAACSQIWVSFWARSSSSLNFLRISFVFLSCFFFSFAEKFISSGWMGACWSNRIETMSSPHPGDNLDISKASISVNPQCKDDIISSSKTATRNFRFDPVVGECGFGYVFNGYIDENSLTAAKPGTGTVVAVEILNKEGLQAHKEWLAEMNYLGQLRHPNLVKLMGYCFEGDQRLLVYEYMSKKSLENHLFGGGVLFRGTYVEHSDEHRPWCSSGLAFLHNTEMNIIYRDFKTSNILLDSNYNAKLSDFGLASDISYVSTQIAESYGYIAPEYLTTGHLTAKSDVYSFGVVLLEILSGLRAIDKNRPVGQQNLVQWAKPY